MFCDSSEHDLDHCPDEEAVGETYLVLDIPCESSAAAYPGEATLDNPAFQKQFEGRQVVAHDVL